MEWIKRFDADRQPTEAEITDFIANPLWASINEFIQARYECKPSYSYSACTGQPGWNVKYQKAGRSLCTLYPMPGYFIALIVIGAKEQNEAEMLMPACTEYVQNLFQNTPFSAGGRWLMVHVTDENILADVERLIQVRRRLTK